MLRRLISTHPSPVTAALSVWMSKVQRSSTSLDTELVTTRATFCSAPVPSHSALRHRAVTAGGDLPPQNARNKRAGELTGWRRCTS